MTVKTKFYNWQKPQKAHVLKFRKESPNLRGLVTWLTKRYGGQNLGIFQKREIRGGGYPSTHSFGAALDWRYPNRVAAKQSMKFMIAYSEELGIQAIHDYVGGCIWHAGRGWKKQEPDQHGMGQAWASWLHIEVVPSAWADKRPIAVKVGEHNLP